MLVICSQTPIPSWKHVTFDSCSIIDKIRFVDFAYCESETCKKLTSVVLVDDSKFSNWRH